jgi:hypothetical protein
MHTNKSIPEPWLFFLRELDSAVREETGRQGQLLAGVA